MNRHRKQFQNAWFVVLAGSLIWAGTAEASLSRNAAGAKNIGGEGRFAMDTSGQFEKDADGRGMTLESSLQFQAAKRLQLLVEATLLDAQWPDVGEHVSGLGDVDVTASWLALPATDLRPSIVFGAHVKLPTASNEAIGTKKPDVSALIVVQREAGELELALETEYLSFGQPEGVKLQNQLLYTLTAEYGVSDFLSVYGEIFGSSAPSNTSSRTDAARLGAEFDIPVNEAVAPYLSFEYDTEGLAAARVGIEWKW